MRRRKFIKTTALATGGFTLGFPALKSFAESGQSDLVLIRNGNPAQLVQKAIELMGGMGRFVRAGQTVVVKPNIGWDRAPEYAANTNPEVAAEVVRLCVEAGAKKVLAFDRTCNNARRCYINSGLEKSMSDAGATVRFIRDKLFEPVKIENGLVLDEWSFYRDALEADVFINVPVLKHHSLSRLTLGLKNMMGVIGQDRGKIHKSFDKKIADLNKVIKPDLTVIDAVRVLRKNGPSGGNLGDVEQMDTLIAGIDPVLTDTWGANVFGLDPRRLGWLEYSQSSGLGTMDTVNNQPLEYSFM